MAPSGPAESRETIAGRVIASHGRHVLVETPAGSRHACTLFGRRLEAVCGDEVKWVPADRDGYGVVTERLPRRTELSRTNARGLYWTIPQQLAHATVNGASIRTGDLFATGTISGSERGSEGSLIELTSNGAHPIRLGDGSTRTFLEDDDEVVLRGRAGELELAEVRGRILPAGTL